MPEIGRQQGEPRLWIMALPIGVKQRGYREPMTNIVKPRSTGGRVWQKACTPHQGAKRPLHNGLEQTRAGGGDEQRGGVGRRSVAMLAEDSPDGPPS